ncbi:hypothetical protein NM688_g5380 [Phlebia brevispora]|uniref:Uncharacterized protein n=1 Tax=Phlebia brevispora TaxID=194682 RepID=A0ACC1SW02_9APHY|nr:hypothetical protein NM688_g5380 [Phlebia brevispora]
MSDIFPPVDPTSRQPRNDKDTSDIEDRPSTPPNVRARPAPRSPGVRLLDAFGREIVEDDTVSTPEEPEERAERRKSVNEKASSSTLSRRRGPPVRMVDAMGREITEVSIEDSEHSESYDIPISRSEALARVRRTLTSLVDDLGDSDTSRDVLPTSDQRLTDLYNASNAARAARKTINESLQKHKSVEDELRAKYGSVRESMNRSKLLPPVVASRKYSVNFLNTWVLWILLIFQIFVLIYMYHLSAVRAKHIFLTTYYDAFHPDLFLHLTKHRAIPASTSWSLSVISETLIRAGWRGLMSEIWGNVTLLVDDVRNNLWDAWGQQRTPVWPPT